jgi:hypothetical protein
MIAGDLCSDSIIAPHKIYNSGCYICYGALKQPFRLCFEYRRGHVSSMHYFGFGDDIKGIPTAAAFESDLNLKIIFESAAKKGNPTALNLG